MRILYVTTIGSTMNFFKSFISELVSNGHTVDIASNNEITPVPEFYNELSCKQYHIDCTRSPLDSGNIKCIKQIRELVKENNYDIVHCHTPIAAFCTRLACKNIRKKRVSTNNPLRVFYTAHGFHFYKGAPIKNWIIFYPIEKLCARWTDTLITINRDDYDLAKKKFDSLGKNKFQHGCNVEYVPGVGVDVNKFANTVVDRKAKRAELGIPEDALLLLSVGELNENKNHQIAIKALAALQANSDKKYCYIIAGDGPLKDDLNMLIDSLGINDKIKLLGFRKDCAELYKISDLFIHPSIREGLPVSVMEAMSSGIMCVGSNIRGNRDLIDETNLFNPRDIADVIRAISKYNKFVFDVKTFGYDVVNSCLMKLYCNHEECINH